MGGFATLGHRAVSLATAGHGAAVCEWKERSEWGRCSFEQTFLVSTQLIVLAVLSLVEVDLYTALRTIDAGLAVSVVHVQCGEV